MGQMLKENNKILSIKFNWDIDSEKSRPKSYRNDMSFYQKQIIFVKDLK